MEDGAIADYFYNKFQTGPYFDNLAKCRLVKRCMDELEQHYQSVIKELKDTFCFCEDAKVLCGNCLLIEKTIQKKRVEDGIIVEPICP